MIVSVNGYIRKITSQLQENHHLDINFVCLPKRMSKMSVRVGLSYRFSIQFSLVAIIFQAYNWEPVGYKDSIQCIYLLKSSKINLGHAHNRKCNDVQTSRDKSTPDLPLIEPKPTMKRTERCEVT